MIYFYKGSGIFSSLYATSTDYFVQISIHVFTLPKIFLKMYIHYYVNVNPQSYSKVVGIPCFALFTDSMDKGGEVHGEHATPILAKFQ